MKSLRDWMMPKKREKSLGVHGSSVPTVKHLPKIYPVYFISFFKIFLYFFCLFYKKLL